MVKHVYITEIDFIEVLPGVGSQLGQFFKTRNEFLIEILKSGDFHI